MRRSTFPYRGATTALVAFIIAAPDLALAQGAEAQGTDEQREACTPDAVRLCSDTIPDIPRTTACMKAHEAQLSARCRAAFATAPEPASRAAEAPAPVQSTEAPPLPGSVAAYRADIARDCAEGLIDAFTCRSTLDALKGAE